MVVPGSGVSLISTAVASGVAAAADVALLALDSAAAASAWSTACAAERAHKACAAIAFAGIRIASGTGPKELLAGNASVNVARAEAALFAINATNPGVAATTAALRGGDPVVPSILDPILASGSRATASATAG